MKLHLLVTPNARASEILGWDDDPSAGRVLRVRVAAPATDGKANAAVRELLAKALGIPKSQVTLDKGTTSRHKTLSLPDHLIHSSTLLRGLTKAPPPPSA